MSIGSFNVDPRWRDASLPPLVRSANETPPRGTRWNSTTQPAVAPASTDADVSSSEVDSRQTTSTSASTAQPSLQPLTNDPVLPTVANGQAVNPVAADPDAPVAVTPANPEVANLPPVQQVPKPDQVLLAGRPAGERRHGYGGGVMGSTEVTGATGVSLSVKLGPVTFYGARIYPDGHGAEDFFTVSTSAGSQFLKAVAAALRAKGKVSGAQLRLLDSRIKAADYILAQGMLANAESARRGGPARAHGHGHHGADVDLDTGVYFYAPAGAGGSALKSLMDAFVDWRQGKPIRLEKLDGVGLGLYATPTAGVHGKLGSVLQIGAHGLWGAFMGVKFDGGAAKSDFFTVGEVAVGAGVGSVEASASVLYFRSFEAPESSDYKKNPFDVISAKDPSSGLSAAVQVPDRGVDATLWKAALKFHDVSKPDLSAQRFKGTNPVNQIAPMTYRAFQVYTALKSALSDPNFAREFRRAPDYYLRRMFPGYSPEDIRSAMWTISWEKQTGLNYMNVFATHPKDEGH